MEKKLVPSLQQIRYQKSLKHKLPELEKKHLQNMIKKQKQHQEEILKEKRQSQDMVKKLNQQLKKSKQIRSPDEVYNEALIDDRELYQVLQRSFRQR